MCNRLNDNDLCGTGKIYVMNKQAGPSGMRAGTMMQKYN